MGADDKIRHALDDAKGTVKENVGRMTDNEEMEAEGKAERLKADIGKTADKVQDKVTGS